MKKNRMNARVRLLPLAIVVAIAGCSEYRSFEWDGALGWEAARMRAQERDIRTMAASLERGRSGSSSAQHEALAKITGDRHVVMPGDTASGVADAAGMSLRELASINRLDPPYTIFVGQVLLTRPLPAGKNTHTVQRGETFLSIANTYGRRMDELRELNPGLDIDRIRVGQQLVIKDDGTLRTGNEPVQLAVRKTAPKPAEEGIVRRTQRVAATAPVPDLSSQGFLWPVDGTVVTRFGVRSDGKRSDGIDIRAAKGSTVKATESGIVVYAGGDIPSMGRMLMIRHAGGYLSAYAHNDTLLVRTGDAVRRGQPVAKVGDTGDISEPRLHFELRKGKEPLDPLTRLPGAGVRVASSE
ncbi:MAG: M23 family metallopeptidase [Geminicoccaceae bacterium]